MDHDHGSMDTGSEATETSATSSHSHFSGEIMPVVFQWFLRTPIYSDAFTPQTGGQYVGALIFLAVLAITWRALTSYKSYKEAGWASAERSRSIVIARLDEKVDAEVSSGEVKKVAPWRWQVDAVRASLSFVTHGLGYLLMLAVMSLNVGYFFAVLGGIFLGDLAFGRYAHS